jgi:hypothetical protein
MKVRLTSLRPRTLLLASVVVGAAVAAGFAQNGGATPPGSGVSCPAVAGSQVFQRWGDSSSYVLAPGGDFENGAPGWTLAGGAALTSGNETFFAHAAGDKTSVTIPAGGSVTSPAICIDQTMPTMRVFASGLNSAKASLTVEALYVDASGVGGWRKLDKVKSTADWTAQQSFKLPAKIESQTVQFRFSVDGPGSYKIDDVYVDPYMRR